MAWFPIPDKPDWEYSTDPNLDKKPIDHYDYDNDAVHVRGKKKLFAGEKFVLARQRFNQHPGYGEIYVKDPAIKALFAGRTAIVYDPQDFGTLYQDAQGTLPVYRPGTGLVDPPVGLMLDKGQGLELGPELVTNGDFSDGLDGWIVSGQDATHTVSVSNGICYYSSDNTLPDLKIINNGNLLYSTVFYLVTVDYIKVTSGKLYFSLPMYFENCELTNFSYIAGRGAFTRLQINRASLNTVGEFSGISIREIKGYHAYQSTPTARPTLSGRYNLLTNTGFAGAVSGTPGSAPTGWIYPAVGGTTEVSNETLRVTCVNNRHICQYGPVTASANTTYLVSVAVQNLTATTPYRDLLLVLSPPVGTILTTYKDGVEVVPGNIAPIGTYNLEIGVAVGSTAGSFSCRIGVGCNTTSTGDAIFWHPDLRVANDGVGLPPYQRVVNANTYDTNGFPLYLNFDGVDDFLQTANVDLTGTDEMTLGVGVRKLSDALAGGLIERSANFANNPGSFVLLAPASTAADNFNFAANTTTVAGLATSTPRYTSPTTQWVVCTCGNGKITMKVGETYSKSTTIPVGNIGNYPLYIGVRGGGTSPFKGRIYSLCIIGSLLSTSEQAVLEQYLNAKTRAY